MSNEDSNAIIKVNPYNKIREFLGIQNGLEVIGEAPETPTNPEPIIRFKQRNSHHLRCLDERVK